MTGFAYDPPMLFLLLIGGHAAADFGLQSTYMATAKSRHDAPNPHWLPVLFAHAAMHGAIVGLATGIAWLGWAEIACHFLIDDRKCARKFGYSVDQGLHYACKLAWGLIAIGLYRHWI